MLRVVNAILHVKLFGNYYRLRRGVSYRPHPQGLTGFTGRKRRVLSAEPLRSSIKVHEP